MARVPLSGTGQQGGRGLRRCIEIASHLHLSGQRIYLTLLSLRVDRSGQASEPMRATSLRASFFNTMKATNEQVMQIATAFKQAIIANLKDQASKAGGEIELGVENLKAAAFPAFEEAAESVFDAEGQPVELSPIACAVIWEGVLKVNESAFRQGLARLEKAGTLGFKIKQSGKTVSGMALKYLG